MKRRRPVLGLAAAAAAIAVTWPSFAGQDEAAWSESTLRFKGLDDFEFILPSPRASNLDAGWQALGDAIVIRGVRFPIEIEGAMKFVLDTDGDEVPDTDVKGLSDYVELEGVTEDGEEFEYAIRVQNSGDRKWNWASAGVMTGRVEGTTISLVDVNRNGEYDDMGTDAIVIGRDRGAAYLSPVVNLDDELFELEVEVDGSVVRTRPYTGEVGTLSADDLEKVKAKLVSAVFKNRKDGTSFQVAGHGKGLSVPAGEYVLDSGYLERGSESARIARGKMETFEVVAGQTHELEWGGPVVGTMSDPQRAGDRVTVRPDFEILGIAGEEYHTFLPKKKTPKVFVLDKETGRTLEKGVFPAG